MFQKLRVEMFIYLETFLDLMYDYIYQGCGAKAICFGLRLRLSKSFGSGSIHSLELPVITDFLFFKKGIFHVFYERISGEFTC